MYTIYTYSTHIHTHTHAQAILGTTILTRTKKKMQEQWKNINEQITKTNEYFRKISLKGSGRTKTQERQQQNSFDFECTLIIGENCFWFFVCVSSIAFYVWMSFNLFIVCTTRNALGLSTLYRVEFSILSCAFATILNCTQQLSTFPSERWRNCSSRSNRSIIADERVAWTRGSANRRNSLV